MTDNADKFLPYGAQTIEDDDIAAVVAALKGPYLTTGPAVPALEAALSERLDGAHVVVCSNGTAALHIMAMALRLEPGDVVVVPAVTFLATANAFRYVGAEVVFADVDLETGMMTPETLVDAVARSERQFSRKPKAAIPVHLAGQPADLPGLHACCETFGMALLDDAAHAIGTKYVSDGGLHAVGGGAHSVMTSFSFHPVKTITMGEGGAVATKSPALAKMLALARNHGMDRDEKNWQSDGAGFDADGKPLPWYYEMQEPGFNYRATDIQAALGLSQLRKLDRFTAGRQSLVDTYRLAFASRNLPVQPLRSTSDAPVGWHLFVVRIPFGQIGIPRATVMQRLKERGVGSQVHYIPLHYQPYYRQRYGVIDLPGARQYYEEALSLPLYPGMTDADVQRVVEALAGALL